MKTILINIKLINFYLNYLSKKGMGATTGLGAEPTTGLGAEATTTPTKMWYRQAIVCIGRKYFPNL